VEGFANADVICLLLKQRVMSIIFCVCCNCESVNRGCTTCYLVRAAC